MKMVSIRCAAIGVWLIHAVSFAQVDFPDVNPSNENFAPLSYDEISLQIQQLHDKHPDLTRLTTAQEQFNLPSPGMCGKDRVKPCVTQILHITNFSTFERDEATRPELFISGELHGNERIGPHASLEYARLLLESDNPWIRRLLNTRSVFLTPLTNSLGYDRNTREEGAVDPNRDYPIDQDPKLCMRAIASRIANELYRAHMFQLAITFHAGMEAIAMEWGTQTRLAQTKHKSPDDFALLQIAGALATYSGPVNKNGRNYPVGRMNDLVYPVEGGMEDWAYAGSWDPDSRRNPCSPSTFGGYDAAKTRYTEDMLRTVNILVETSDEKWPRNFGTRLDALNPQSGTGHVARNVRLALMLTDVVQPYLQWTNVTVVGRMVTVRWEVGGAFQVDDTQVTVQDKTTGKQVMESTKYQGRTRWSTGAYGDRTRWPFKTQFASCFDIPVGTHAVVLQARARVDGQWAMTGQQDTVSPRGFKPQTHLVNARTNPEWSKRNGGKTVQGKLDWYSDELDIVLTPPPEEEDTAHRLRGRRRLEDEDVEPGECVGSEASSKEQNEEEEEEKGILASVPYSFVFSGVAFLSFTAMGCHMHRTRQTHSRLPTSVDIE